MSDKDSVRTGSSKLMAATLTLAVQSGVSEVKTRIANPAHAPGIAGHYQAFDVYDANNSPHAIAVDVTGATAS